MAASFTRKSFAEVSILLVGAVIAATGKQQNSPPLLGLGVIIIGAGVIWGGIGAIHRRRLAFLHSEARFITHRVTGGAAVIWGVLLVLAGLTLAAGGIGLALGYEAALRALVLQPGSWLIAGGIALSFLSAAAVWQNVSKGRQGALAILLALPGTAVAVLGLLIGIGLAGTGAWGLQDPAGLKALGTDLAQAARAWLERS